MITRANPGAGHRQGPRDTPTTRVTGWRTSKRQPEKPGVSVIGDIEGQVFLHGTDILHRGEYLKVEGGEERI